MGFEGNKYEPGQNTGNKKKPIVPFFKLDKLPTKKEECRKKCKQLYIVRPFQLIRQCIIKYKGEQRKK